MVVIYIPASNASPTLAIPHHSPPLQFHRPSLCSRSTWSWHLSRKLSASQPLTLDLKRSVPSLALSHGHESVDRNDAASTGPLINPHPGLTAEEAVKAQLDALLRNDEPRKDHGLEVMYHFANAEGTLDGGSLSCYFGFPADLYHFGHFCMKFKSRFQKLLSFKKFLVDGEALVIDPAAARLRVLITGTDGSTSVWTFILSKVQRGTQSFCWMTDAIIEEQNYETF